MSTAKEALQKLLEGNERFASGHQHRDAPIMRTDLQQLASGQKPFAIILGCSDSRAPAEILFDQGLGDLFVIRVAGNIAAPSQVGSIEFAAATFGTQLVVVLGHSQCGAVKATIEDLVNPTGEHNPNIESIVSRVRPSVKPLLKDHPNDDEALMKQAVRANVMATVNHLRHGSAILEHLVLNDGLCIVGAEYDIASGSVDFFDGVEECQNS